jgi:hypothetical protein
LRDAIFTAIGSTPAQMQGYLYYLVQMTPKITFILGAGTGRSAATLPLSFEFPELPPVPPFNGGVIPGTPGGVPVGSPDLGGPIGLPPVDGPVGGGGQGPDLAGPPLTPASDASEDPFSGIPPSLFLLVAVSAGLLGWGLTRLRDLAFAGVLAGPCTDGTSPTLPDLRGA